MSICTSVYQIIMKVEEGNVSGHVYSPIAEVAIVKLVHKQRDDPVLRCAFWLANGVWWHTGFILGYLNNCT
jgi:hypothetical protein